MQWQKMQIISLLNHAENTRILSYYFLSIATPHFPHQSAPAKYKDLYPQSELTLAPNVPAGNGSSN